MKKYMAEILGTFLLVFIGCGSVVLGNLGSVFPVAQGFVGLAFGIGVIAAAYAIGPISGAHLNPAVSIGVFLSGRMSAGDMIGYWVAQVIGAVIAALALVVICSGSATPVTNFAANGWDVTKWSTTSAFVAEVITTFTFVTVILGVTAKKHATAFAGLVIGLTLAALITCMIPLTGASLNPARSIGPALFSGSAAIGQVWLFIAAPLIGGALAGIVARIKMFELE